MRLKSNVTAQQFHLSHGNVKAFIFAQRTHDKEHFLSASADFFFRLILSMLCLAAVSLSEDFKLFVSPVLLASTGGGGGRRSAGGWETYFFSFSQPDITDSYFPPDDQDRDSGDGNYQTSYIYTVAGQWRCTLRAKAGGHESNTLLMDY